MHQTSSRTSIGNTQEPQDTSGRQNFSPSLSNPPSCQDVTILKGGGCQRTPQSTSHYSRHRRQSPIRSSTQTAEPRPATRDLTVVQPTCPTYVSGLCVRTMCQDYVSDLRQVYVAGLSIHPTCPTVGPLYYFNYLSLLTPY